MRGAVPEERGPHGALVAVAADGDRRGDRHSLPRRAVEAGHAHPFAVLLQGLEAVSEPQHARPEPRRQVVHELVPGEVPEPVVPLFEDARRRVGADPELARGRVEVLHGGVREEAGEDGGAELWVEGLEGGDAVAWFGFLLLVVVVVVSGLKRKNEGKMVRRATSSNRFECSSLSLLSFSSLSLSLSLYALSFPSLTHQTDSEPDGLEAPSAL